MGKPWPTTLPPSRSVLSNSLTMIIPPCILADIPAGSGHVPPEFVNPALAFFIPQIKSYKKRWVLINIIMKTDNSARGRRILRETDETEKIYRFKLKICCGAECKTWQKNRESIKNGVFILKRILILNLLLNIIMKTDNSARGRRILRKTDETEKIYRFKPKMCCSAEYKT